MANQLNRIKNNWIENKIREFKIGVDYNLAGEKYHPRNGSIKAYTTRNYKILSPQLQKVVQEYLSQQTAIFMQFDFKKTVFISERIRPDNSGKDWEEKYHANVDDENGDSLNYGYYGEPGSWRLLITHTSSPDKRKRFNQAYQEAKRTWEQKGSLLPNTPPSGTKCWNCYEVISDEDIAADRYKVKNTCLGPTSESKRLNVFKTFEHVKGVCKPLEYDCALRNNYHYYSELGEKWLEYPQKRHEYNCQDCLNWFWNEVNGNLIYLETWAKEQVQEIAHTKQVLAEIEARLAKLKESSQFHNCGIKKCCAEHDKNESHRHGNNELIEENKNLTIGSNSKSIPNSKQINEEEKNQIKEYFKTKSIFSITLDGDELVIVHNDKSQEIVEINNSQLQLIKAVVQNQPNQSLSFSELQNYTNNSSSQENNNKLYYGLAIGVISGIILVVLALIFANRKKSSSKKN